MKTRKQYVNNECTHDEYYAQFGKHLVELVSNTIGKERIENSNDPHFNDISLNRWDNLAGAVRMKCGKSIGEANGNGGVSLSDCVCSAKSAAKIIRDNKQTLEK